MHHKVPADEPWRSQSASETVDPQAQRVLDIVARRDVPDRASLSPAQARELSRSDREFHGPALEMAEVRDLPIRVHDRTIPTRLYHPRQRRRDALLIWLHGGGWVVGDLDGADVDCRALAHACEFSVLSVQYRLAPEHPFPAGLDDVHDATLWAKSACSLLEVDRDFFLAVGGDSAGGNLAASLAIAARDAGEPRIDFQLLVYPVTDFDLDTVCFQRLGDGYWLTRDGMQWNWDHYLAETERRADPLASPLRATSHGNLPPAFILTAEFDPLCDEGEAYARRLYAAGVATTLSRYDGMIHGFMSCAGAIDAASDAVAECGDVLRTALEQGERGG